MVAGIVNAIGLLSFEHQSVSHLTGTATLLGTGVLTSEPMSTIHLVGVLLAFMAGASAAGFLLHGSTLKLGRHYDTALLCEALLLLASLWLLRGGSFAGHFFASAACGLQNGLATTYSGAVIRTTHVTGIFTDLGIMLGSRARGQAIDSRKARLFIYIIIGFIVGGALGAWLFARYDVAALALPAAICLIIAGMYRAGYRRGV